MSSSCDIRTILECLLRRFIILANDRKLGFFGRMISLTTASPMDGVWSMATGDKVRLYAKTYATVNGKPSFIGSNGHVLEVRGWTDDGIILRDAKGRDGRVTWDRLTDRKTGRLQLGFGHAVTIDSSQGMTTGEHINAMPRGSAGATGFKSYVAESRHIKQAFTVVSEAAVFEAVKHRRALGEARFRVRFQQASPFAGWTAPLAARPRVAGDLPPIGNMLLEGAFVPSRGRSASKSDDTAGVMNAVSAAAAMSWSLFRRALEDESELKTP